MGYITWMPRRVSKGANANALQVCSWLIKIKSPSSVSIMKGEKRGGYRTNGMYPLISFKKEGKELVKNNISGIALYL